MGVNDVDACRSEPRTGDRGTHTLGLTRGIGQNIVGGVGVDVIAGDFGAELPRAASLSVFEALQRVEATTLGSNETVAGLVEGPRGPCGDQRGSPKRFGSLKPAKIPKVWMLSLMPPQIAKLHFAEPQHLRGVDQAHVAGAAQAAPIV